MATSLSEHMLIRTEAGTWRLPVIPVSCWIRGRLGKGSRVVAGAPEELREQLGSKWCGLYFNH